jgi:hypothetical protein
LISKLNAGQGEDQERRWRTCLPNPKVEASVSRRGSVSRMMDVMMRAELACCGRRRKCGADHQFDLVQYLEAVKGVHSWFAGYGVAATLAAI